MPLVHTLTLGFRLGTLLTLVSETEVPKVALLQ